jgi:formate--tetrahydrofolate ligase
VSQFAPLYNDEMSLFGKIERVATAIYRADEVLADKKIRDQLRTWEEAGYGHLPVCMAKTQYSFSTDPNLRGAPTGHSVPIREVRLSAGAGFVVVICGEIMTMPGLPRKPAAETIRINDEGLVEGLF